MARPKCVCHFGGYIYGPHLSIYLFIYLSGGGTSSTNNGWVGEIMVTYLGIIHQQEAIYYQKSLTCRCIDTIFSSTKQKANEIIGCLWELKVVACANYFVTFHPLPKKKKSPGFFFFFWKISKTHNILKTWNPKFINKIKEPPQHLYVVNTLG
jgi:hypothetical protein